MSEPMLRGHRCYYANAVGRCPSYDTTEFRVVNAQHKLVPSFLCAKHAAEVAASPR